MITFAILILIVAKALPGLNTHISSIHVTRITTIVFLFSGALTLNSLNIESIGSGIGIYSGLFQVTTISQLIEIFLFMIGGGILIAWPQTIQTKPSPGGSSDPPFALSPGILRSKAEGRLRTMQGCCATDYSLVVLFSSLGSSLLISSYDLISVYLSIELQSFGLYVLSTLNRDSESSTSAGLKYFLLGGLSSCIILLGTGIIYSYTGTTNLESLYIINSVTGISQLYIIQGISLGLSLIFIGFLFKIAAAPLHNWSPDVYDGTPTIVTTWLTIIPKIAILFILLELQIKLGTFGPLGEGLKTIFVNNSGYLLNLNQINDFIYLNFISPCPSLAIGKVAAQGTTFGDSSVQPLPSLALGLGEATAPSPLGLDLPLHSIVATLTPWEGTNLGFNILKTLLLISATLSLIIGSLLGLAQIRIKRLLAYSTISHIGFILLALAVNTEQSIDSFIFYIIQYTITNLNIFLVILGLTYWGNKDIGFISEFKGLFFSNPLLSISLAVSLFSMAGIPPLIGFFSKQLVLYSALQNGYFFISVLAIIVSVISCSYYLQIIKVLFTPSDGHARPSFGVPTATQEAVATQEAAISSTAFKPKATESSESLVLNRRTSSEGAVLLRNKREGSTSSCGNPLLRRVARDKPLPLLSLGEESPSGATQQRRGVKNEIHLTNTHSYLISTLTFTILLFFIKPSLILNSTQLLSLSLFYI